MLNNKNTVILQLNRLGLSADESRVYLALLEKPLSHLEIARKTGVNRTKVYRIADGLIKRGLVAENQDDTGRQLVANDPNNLEINIKTEEERLDRKKLALRDVLPGLQSLYSRSGTPGESGFEVNTYEGVDGFKQMLWNELKTNGEILIFGYGSIQDLVNSSRWAEKHREKTVEAGYKIRELLNPGSKPSEFTNNKDFMEQSYQKRYISEDVLPLAHQLCIYNNTVAIYNWRNEQKVGIEIINKSFADMQRDVFRNYWRQVESTQL